MFATFYLTGRISSQLAKQSKSELDGSEINEMESICFKTDAVMHQNRSL